MDAPKCRACDERHWGLTCKATGIVKEVKARSLTVKPIPHKNLDVGSSPAALTVECPICAARRETKARAQKRWRAKVKALA